MSAHTLHADLHKALRFHMNLQDPGDAGAIRCDGRGFATMALESAAAETRTLPDPTAPGQILVLYLLTDGGDIVVTASTAYDESGSTTLTFNDAGDVAVLVAVRDGSSGNDSYAWRLAGYDGVKGPPLALTGSTISAGQAFLEKVTQTAKTDTATLTIAELLTKVIDGTATAAATYTLPTAALLVAGIKDCRVGDSFQFLVNAKAATHTITVAAGTGGTADGTLTVATGVIRAFRVIVTAVASGSEAYFVYGIG